MSFSLSLSLFHSLWYQISKFPNIFHIFSFLPVTLHNPFGVSGLSHLVSFRCSGVFICMCMCVRAWIVLKKLNHLLPNSTTKTHLTTITWTANTFIFPSSNLPRGISTKPFLPTLATLVLFSHNDPHRKYVKDFLYQSSSRHFCNSTWLMPLFLFLFLFFFFFESPHTLFTRIPFVCCVLILSYKSTCSLPSERL